MENTAKQIIKDSLPIKCLEAVILAIYLTRRNTDLHRFTIAFKTEFNGTNFRHVVLGIQNQNKFGALGISRRADLMFKPLQYPSLSILLEEYIKAYEKYFHKVLRIKIGLVIPHEPHILEVIRWRGLIISPSRFRSRMDMNEVIERYSKVVSIKRILKNIGTVWFCSRTGNFNQYFPNSNELIARYLALNAVIKRGSHISKEEIKIRIRTPIYSHRKAKKKTIVLPDVVKPHHKGNCCSFRSNHFELAEPEPSYKIRV
ncbi:unnamed protein product [Protopolystoma xenopodis]|uniref:Uncharacterized protein n=1 Tax=Protopolystoma xenopodis TaxID=117903 RepID=A0A3S5CQR4_9PLAT|nr:unnamed protein product [Protopolystoma xenopodis]